MRRSTWAGAAAAVLAFMIFSGPISGGEELSLKDVFQKNLEASGGREKLGRFKNLSFKTGTTRIVAAANGDLKLMTGKDPVITETILVRDGRVQRNSYGTILDVPEPEKTVYQTLARLYAGLFSLIQFEGELRLLGPKSFGPETLYHLAPAKSGAVEVGFFLQTEDFLLKRLLFRGQTSDGDIYEVNIDYGPFEPVEDLKLPLSWFSSQVGTRGNLAEVTEVQLDQPLPKDFFSELKVNVGTTEAQPGQLIGNVLDFNSSRYGLSVVTNWRKNDIENAGLQTGDKLSFLVEGMEFEVDFYGSVGELPPQDEMSQGARLMMPMPRGGETFVLQFIAVDTEPIASKLKLLTPIEIKKK